MPGAFDGWVTLLEKHGTMKLADLLAPAIDYAENGFPVMEKIAADWEPEVAKLKLTRGGRVHLPRQRRRAAAGRDLRTEEPRANAPHAGARRPRRVLSGRDRAGHRRLLPEERRLPLDGGLRGAEVGMGRADLDDLSRPHALRAAAERPGADGAASSLNILEGIDLTAMRTQPGPLLPHADRSDEDRLRRSQPLHRRSGVREGAGEGAAVEGLRRPPARADRSEEGDRPARRTATSAWAATRPTSPSSTRTATRCRSSTASSIRVRIGDRRRRHRHHAAQSRHRLLARARASQSHRARQAAVPHAHPGDGVQGRQAADVVRRDGRRRPGAGTRAGAREPDRSRDEPAAGDRRAARALHQRPRRDDGGRS